MSGLPTGGNLKQEHKSGSLVGRDCIRRDTFVAIGGFGCLVPAAVHRNGGRCVASRDRGAVGGSRNRPSVRPPERLLGHLRIGSSAAGAPVVESKGGIGRIGKIAARMGRRDRLNSSYNSTDHDLNPPSPNTTASDCRSAVRSAPRRSARFWGCNPPGRRRRALPFSCWDEANRCPTAPGRGRV